MVTSFPTWFDLDDYLPTWQSHHDCTCRGKRCTDEWHLFVWLIERHVPQAYHLARATTTQLRFSEEVITVGDYFGPPYPYRYVPVFIHADQDITAFMDLLPACEDPFEPLGEGGEARWRGRKRRARDREAAAACPRPGAERLAAPRRGELLVRCTIAERKKNEALMSRIRA